MRDDDEDDEQLQLSCHDNVNTFSSNYRIKMDRQAGNSININQNV